MASPNKKDELINELTQLSSREKWLAVAFLYVRNRSDAEDVLQNTILDLYNQNTEGVRDIHAFLAQVIINKAKARFNEKAGSNKIAGAAYNNTTEETTDTLFTQMEMATIMNEIKQHRDKLDYILFEMHIQGYGYKDIAIRTGEKEGTLRKRIFELRKWLKGFLNNER
jgi:DNA-directed RNA polymerase specialized sigma24 family protein